MEMNSINSIKGISSSEVKKAEQQEVAHDNKYVGETVTSETLAMDPKAVLGTSMIKTPKASKAELLKAFEKCCDKFGEDKTAIKECFAEEIDSYNNFNKDLALAILPQVKNATYFYIINDLLKEIDTEAKKEFVEQNVFNKPIKIPGKSMLGGLALLTKDENRYKIKTYGYQEVDKFEADRFSKDEQKRKVSKEFREIPTLNVEKLTNLIKNLNPINSRFAQDAIGALCCDSDTLRLKYINEDTVALAEKIYPHKGFVYTTALLEQLSELKNNLSTMGVDEKTAQKIVQEFMDKLSTAIPKDDMTEFMDPEWYTK